MSFSEGRPAGGTGRAGKRGIHYGWIVAAACFMVVTSLGETFYAFGPFIKPLEEEFGWSRTITSSVFTFFLMTFATSGFVGGALADKYGSRRVLTGAGLVTGTGFMLATQTEDIWHLRLSLAWAGLGAGATWPIPAATVSRWFVKRQGMVLGIMSCGVGVGALFIVPLANYLISLWGWRGAFFFLGSLYMVSIVFASLLVVHSPKEKGLKPYGAEEGDNPPRASVALPPVGLDFAQAVRTPAFVGVVALQAIIQVPMQIVMVHLIPFAMGAGVSAALAASALGLEGGFTIPGRLAGGAFCDRIGWKQALALSNMGLGLMCLFLLMVKSYGMLLLFVVLFGFFHGGRTPPLVGILSYLFGTRALGGLIGITFALSLLAGSAGPYLAGFIFDRTESYSLAFLMSALLFALGGSLALLLKPPLRRPTGA